MKVTIQSLRLFVVLIFALFQMSACGTVTKAGSISPKMDQNSFSDLSSLESDASLLAYNPALRLESEIAPGYLVEVSSNQDQNINGEFRISEQGILDLPYAVKVDTSNSSIAELRSLIRDSYRTYFRGSPDIEVKIKERKVWVRAQGLVNKPGTYLVEPEAGLDEVISQADGLKTSSDGISAPRFAKINAYGNEVVIRLADFYAGNSSVVSHWRGGESIFFQSDLQKGAAQVAFDSKYVHVLGQVRAPGEYAFKDNATFLHYLVQAGGPTDRANTNNILLVSTKSQDGKFETTKLSLSNLEEVQSLKGGDVLFVQADNRSDLERDAGVLGGFGGFLGAIATTILVGNEL